MRIDSLQLNGYIRLNLNNIHSITITPTTAIQFLLGTNGSGKSSLLKEMTPLPGDQDHFIKGGFKIIKITDRNIKYILTSRFDQKTTHSFIKIIGGEEVEMNPGGTVTVQRTLVQAEFKITAETHDLITGGELFHAMSPTRRREWLTKLCPQNYDYAFSLFNHIKESGRDIAALLRDAKKQIRSDAFSLITVDDEVKLRQQVELIHKELNLLLRESTPTQKALNDLQSKRNAIEQELSTAANRLLRMRLVAPYGTQAYGSDITSARNKDEWGDTLIPAIKCQADVDRCIDVLKHQATACATKIELAVRETEKLNEHLTILEKTEKDGLASIEGKITQLTNSLTDATLNLKLGLIFEDVDAATNALTTIDSSISNIFSVLPSNQDRKFSSALLDETQQALYQKTDEVNKLNNLIGADQLKLDHLKLHNEKNTATCPECNHQWILSQYDDSINVLPQRIADMSDKVVALTKEKEHLTDTLNKIQEYAALYRDYVKITRSWPVLNPLWELLQQNDMVSTAPSRVLPTIAKVLEDLTINKEINTLEAEIKELSSLLQSANQIGDEKLIDVKEKLLSSKNTVAMSTADLHRINQDIANYQQYRNQLIEADRLSAKINALVQDVSSITEEMIESVRQDSINHCIRQLHSSLAVKQEALNKAVMHKAKVLELEETVKRLTIEEECFKMLINEMSPTDGLIASGLVGYVRRFARQMNVLIRKIWTYPLVIQDCGVVGEGSVELNYRFPLMVQTKDNIRKDIKEGSTGMTAVIDLAFIVEAMKALGLGESPLYLDEWGKSLDEAHRDAAANAIKNIMDTQAFSQLFMVSHYNTMYGVFTNAEFCVLDKRNITVPFEHNKHVIFE
jgi:energy-coupling factor transporter ATP-binding protein EcfA2